VPSLLVRCRQAQVSVADKYVHPEDYSHAMHKHCLSKLLQALDLREVRLPVVHRHPPRLTRWLLLGNAGLPRLGRTYESLLSAGHWGPFFPAGDYEYGIAAARPGLAAQPAQFRGLAGYG